MTISEHKAFQILVCESFYTNKPDQTMRKRFTLSTIFPALQHPSKNFHHVRWQRYVISIINGENQTFAQDMLFY